MLTRPSLQDPIHQPWRLVLRVVAGGFWRHIPGSSPGSGANNRDCDRAKLAAHSADTLGNMARLEAFSAARLGVVHVGRLVPNSRLVS